ncbi:MAG TPA: cytochrome P450, partial [Acidobacteriota bacterium]|nr:cytochrome P450 [Acidobacteriota bacterium]
MSNHEPDWHPLDELMRGDNRVVYDRLREICPVAYSDSFGWSVFRHRDVVEILLDSSRFSNSVSRHLSIPNGLDPPEHTVYRRIVERY